MLTERHIEVKTRLLEFVKDCRSYGEGIGDKTLRNTFDSLAHELNELTFNIAVVGSVKRGKSTLINALLRRNNDDISPIGLTVCTSAITKYRNYTEGMPHEPHAVVEYSSGNRPAEKLSYGELRDLIDQKYNPENEKDIRCITVYGDFPSLGACCLIDTPGADACVERHGQMVAEILPSADAIIMPVLTTEAWTNAEQEMLRSLAEDRKRRIFYVITKVDRAIPDDLKQVADYTRACIAEASLPAPSKLYPVCAKSLYDALKRGADETEVAQLLRSSGLKELEDELSRFITAHSSQGAALSQRLVRAVNEARAALLQRRQLNESFISGVQEDREQIEKDIALVQSEFTELRRSMEKKLNTFSRDWDRACDRGLDRMDSVIDRVTDFLQAEFSRDGFFASLQHSFKLNTLVASKVSREIQPLTDSLQDKLQRVLEKLDADYAESADLYARRVNSTCGVVSTVGILAVGGGVAATTLNVAVPAIQGITTALSGWASAGAAATAAEASVTGFPALLAWAKGGGAVAKASGDAAAAAGVLTGSIASAILPIAISLAALAVAGPISRMILGNRTPSAVQKAVEESKSDMRKQLNQAKEAIISACKEMLQDRQDAMADRIAELRKRLDAFNPEDKQRAETENTAITKLIGEGDALVNIAAYLN